VSKEISAQMVKELRESTGAGMMDCKRALVQSGGDFDQATKILREKGLARAAKRVGREANEGVVEAYIHLAGRIGVLVEVNSETDFVARNDEFRGFAHDVALQIAAMNPGWISPDDVPAEVLSGEREIIRAQAEKEGKPEKVIDRIVAGRMEKFFEENCLLRQPYIKDDKRCVDDVLGDLRARIGENISIRRFVRFEVGGDAVLADASSRAGEDE